MLRPAKITAILMLLTLVSAVSAISQEKIVRDVLSDLNAKIVKFDFTVPGSSVTKTFDIKYQTIASYVEIQSIEIVGNDKEAFSFVSSLTSFPVIIDTSTPIKIILTFSPEKIKCHDAVLKIKLGRPYYDEPVDSMSLIGCSELNNSIWTENRDLIVGDTNVLIPFYTQVSDPFYGIHEANCTFKLSFKADMLCPLGVTKGKITYNEIIGDTRILEIQSETFKLVNDKILLSELKGQALLGANSRTEVAIFDINWNFPWLKTKRSNGSLNTLPSCVRDLNNITSLPQKPQLSIIPFPATDNTLFQLESPENGNFTLSIYNNLGELVKEYSYLQSTDNKTVQQSLHQMDFQNISSGSYYVHLQTPIYSTFIPLLIKK